MKKIAIFGGSGFIGTNLINTLKKYNCEIYNYDIVESNHQSPNCTYKFLDIRNNLNNYRFLEDFDYLYILSALLGRRCNNEPLNGWETNVKGITNLLFSISKLKSKPIVIFSSSAMVYDNYINHLPIRETNPIDGTALYEQSKVIVELIIKSICSVSDFKAIIFRFFTVYGPGPASPTKGHFIPIWMAQANEKNEISIYGDGQQTIDLTHVKDIVNALISVLNFTFTTNNYEIFNIATGIETKVEDVANWFKDLKPDLNLLHIPVNQKYPNRKYADINKAKNLLDYSLTVLPEEGIKSLLKKGS